MFFAVSFLVHRARASSFSLSDVLGLSLWTHRSSKLDAQLYLSRQFLEAVRWWPTLAGSWWLATHLVRRLDDAFGVPTSPDISPMVASLIYMTVLFVVWDLSRYLVHRLMHAVPAL
jgi:sterol desaturase/sphingolipid hydroxylase (fatty acid hydroxylase superfamily)